MDDEGIVSSIQKMAFRASRLPFLVVRKQFPHAEIHKALIRWIRLVLFQEIHQHNIKVGSKGVESH